jgi:hypothetical protein
MTDDKPTADTLENVSRILLRATQDHMTCIVVNIPVEVCSAVTQSLPLHWKYHTRMEVYNKRKHIPIAGWASVAFRQSIGDAMNDIVQIVFSKRDS